MADPQILNLPKMIPETPQTSRLRRTVISSGSGNSSTPQIIISPENKIAQSAGAVEYTDCTSAEG